MAECVTTLYVKKVDLEEFKKWLEREEVGGWPYYDLAQGRELYVEIEGGYGGYFWESLVLKMANAFKGIVFEGSNQVIFGDHLIGTTYSCDGKKITLSRYIELPSDSDDELDEEDKEYFEDMRAFFEAENAIPYRVEFSVKDVITCFEIYEVVGKKVGNLVESTCNEHNISKETFMKFAEIFDFKKRK